MEQILCCHTPAVASALDRRITDNNHWLNSSSKCLTQRESYFWDLVTLFLKIFTEKGWIALLLKVALLEITGNSFLKMILRPLRNMVAWMCKYVCTWVLGVKEIIRKKKSSIQLISSLCLKKIILQILKCFYLYKGKTPLEVYRMN